MSGSGLRLMFSYKLDDEIELALPTLENAAELYRVVRGNLADLQRWMPWASEEYTLESAQSFIRLNLSGLGETGSFSTAVLLDKKIAGMIGYTNLNRTNNSIEIGYWLDREARGRGVITRCARFFVDYAFTRLSLNRVQINCNVENSKSRAVPERLGFKLEGTLRQVELLNGRYRDWAIYGMLAEDWLEKEDE